jgi:hypothetical protein
MASAAVRTGPAAAPPKRALRAEPIRTGHKDSIRAYTRYTYDYDFLATQKDGKPMLSGLLQSNLIYWISRKTVGDEKRPEWGKISISQFAEFCGSDRKSIALALADLIDRQIIEVPKREGCAKNAAKMYKLCPQNWRRARPYSPEVDADLLALAKAVEKGWEADAAEDDDEQPETETRVVDPGKRSRPHPIAMPVKGAEPFMVRVVYHSEFDEPMAFRARAGRNGRLQVTACRPAARTAGDEEAKPCRAAALHGAEGFEANTELTRYRTYLNALMLKLWETAKGEDFIRAVFKAADGAPLEALQNQVALKFKDAQGDATFRKEARKHQPGLLIGLAEDAARAFKLRLQTDKTRTAQMPPIGARKPPEPLNPARRWDRIRQQLQKRLTPESYENWFARTWQMDERGDLMIVGVDGGEETVLLLTEEYGPLIAEICAAVKEPLTIQWRAGR